MKPKHNNESFSILNSQFSIHHTMSDKNIKVLVVDDHPVVRHGILAMLRYEGDIELVATPPTGWRPCASSWSASPTWCCLDLRLPQLSGVEVMRRVKQQLPATRFLVLTTYDTDEYIGPALAAGAQGYLLKDATPDELARAVRALMGGGAALEPGVAARLLGRMSEGEAEELSARELEVLRLLVAGASNKSVAAQLGLSENTVKSHISHIFGKLNVQSRAEAVAVALQTGIVPMGR